MTDTLQHLNSNAIRPAALATNRWANRAIVSGSRQRFLLAALWKQGPLNRRSLHDRTSIRPNTITVDIQNLIQSGIVRELESAPGKRGRPATPLEIDPDQHDVVGLAISPGHVSVARLNLLGTLQESVQEKTGTGAEEILRTARGLLTRGIRPTSLTLGISTTGSVDHALRSSLYGSAWPQSAAVDLQSLYDLAGNRSVVLANDMHAMAARWLLTHRIAGHEDVLLVSFADGQLGSALLIDGKINRGCITAANELGHTHMPVETLPCHCGNPSGCLERICSTQFLNRKGGTIPLIERTRTYQESDTALTELIHLLAMGIANAVNFTRVNQLILVSEMLSAPSFAAVLTKAIRQQLIRDVVDRIHMEIWQKIAGQSAETAGWLGLANLYLDGWGEATELTLPGKFH